MMASQDEPYRLLVPGEEQGRASWDYKRLGEVSESIEIESFVKAVMALVQKISNVQKQAPRKSTY